MMFEDTDLADAVESGAETWTPMEPEVFAGDADGAVAVTDMITGGGAPDEMERLFGGLYDDGASREPGCFDIPPDLRPGGGDVGPTWGRVHYR